MKTALILAVLLVSASAQIDETQLRTDFTIARALMQGFTQGFYANSAYLIDSNCLGEPTIESILKLDRILQTGDFVKFFDILTSIYTISSHTDKYCEFETVMTDLLTFCDTNDCQLETLF